MVGWLRFVGVVICGGVGFLTFCAVSYLFDSKKPHFFDKCYIVGFTAFFVFMLLWAWFVEN